MAGCDGWITIKAFELIFSIFCIIFKRVTDDEASKLFYFLQKISREWALLNNITWDENGAFFTDVVYGGYVIITVGLIIGQCCGELHRAKHLENFFLAVGALVFISAGSLELAALDSVEERLVDNAAILGVVSLITGMLFLVDLILASKRRKKIAARVALKKGIDKTTQTEETKQMEVYRSSGDMNGNMQGHVQQGNGYEPPQFLKMDSKRVPKNGVKILPTSPMIDDGRIPVTNSNNEFIGTIASPIFTPTQLKSPQAKIRSTESFLKSEKGEMPVVRRGEQPQNLVVPPGYVLVPMEPSSDRSTSPGYAQIKPEEKVPKSSGFVMIPIEHLEGAKHDAGRKLQSPTVSTTVRTPQGYYYNDHHLSNLSLSEDEHKSLKYSPDYPHPHKGRKHSPMSDDSTELPKYFPTEHFPHYKEGRRSGKEPEKWSYLAGSSNKAYNNDEVDFVTPFKRNSSTRSSKIGQGDKPKSILRFDQYRISGKKDQKQQEADLNFPKEVNYNSLDSQKIADDLKQLKEIAKSDLDLSRNLEEENQILKERLRREKEEKAKLKQDLQMEIQQKEAEVRNIIQKTSDDFKDRKRLEARISDLEDLKRQMKVELRDADERKRLERTIQDLEDEKDRRISERDEQYFGVADLKQSHKDTSPVSRPKMLDLDSYFRKEGAKDVNVKLKEKVLEMEQIKDEEEVRRVIDDRFHFLDKEEERKKLTRKPEISAKPTLSEKRSAPDLTNIYQKSIDVYRKPKSEGKSPTQWSSAASPSPGQRSDDSDETPYSQITDDGAMSYKSEAQFWMSGEGDKPDSTPTSPRDPGFVLHTAHNWPEASSPQERFRFSAKKAQQVAEEKKIQQPTKIFEFVDFEEPNKSSYTSQLLEHEEIPEPPQKVEGRKKGLLVRKVDFREEPDKIIRPATVTGSTSTWRKWLQPKAKLQSTRSTPN